MTHKVENDSDEKFRIRPKEKTNFFFESFFFFIGSRLTRLHPVHNVNPVQGQPGVSLILSNRLDTENFGRK